MADEPIAWRALEIRFPRIGELMDESALLGASKVEDDDVRRLTSMYKRGRFAGNQSSLGDISLWWCG